MKRVADMTRAELEAEALTDPLTKVGNRRAFDEAEAGPEGPAAFYAVIDLEGTKFVNDEFGHLVGDALIQAAAHVLARHFGREVYRTGGDEFVIRFHGADLVEIKDQAGLYPRLHVYHPPSDLLRQVVERFPLLGYGLGAFLDDAELDLVYRRKVGEQAGERAKRGNRPRHLARVLETAIG